MLQALRKTGCSVKGADTVTMNNKEQPSEVFYKKGVFENFSVFTGKYLCSSLLLMKLWSSRSAALLKRDSKRRCFTVNIAEFLKKRILKKICGRLFLNNVKRN